MGTELYCPSCGSKLSITHKDHYQDLSEHVSNPNGIPSLKDGYQCPNEECVTNKCDVSWIEDGDCFFGERPDGITYTDLVKSLEQSTGHSFAINSWNHHYQLGKDKIKERTITIKLLKYKINLIPKELGHKFPIEKEYQPSWWKWKLEFWKSSGEYSYVHIIPFWRMVKFSVKEFKKEYKNCIINGNQRQLKKLKQRVMGLDICDQVDNRFYVRFTKLWLQIFHPFKVREINKIINV